MIPTYFIIKFKRAYKYKFSYSGFILKEPSSL